MNFNDTLTRIVPADARIADICIARFDQVAKPVGSLGKLEELLAKIASITGSVESTLTARRSSCSARTTAWCVEALRSAVTRLRLPCRYAGDRQSQCSVMAKSCGAEVFSRTLAWWIRLRDS